MAQEGNPGSPESTTGATDDAYLRAVQSVPQLSQVPPMPGIAESSVPKPGQVLAGKYRVERVLGAGGMGVVVAAHHIHLDAPVALKFMTEETFADHSLVARFLHEARATARLRGEHVVRVSDVGQLDSGAPYMVMEFLQGQDLSALLTSLGPPPIASAVEYAIQTCEGLDEAHRAGFVHRDVKPSNLFLTRRPNGTPCIKIVDFGISKAVTMAGVPGILHATSTRAIFGSPLYMAPEQMRAARDVDSRADLWSLGASLYELLSGTVPFAAESLVDLAYRIANEDPPSLCASRPEIPYGLEQIVFRCLEKDRTRRFSDARSLALALEEFRAPRLWLPATESSDEDETRVMDPRVPEPLPQGLTASEGALSVPSVVVVSDAGRPSPASKTAGEPNEPLATSGVSWGRSQRLTRRRSRVRAYLPYLAAVLFVGTVSALIALFTRTHPTPQPSVSAMPRPPVTASTATVAMPEAPIASAELPTVSVMDLPAVPRDPIPAPVAPRAAPKPADSPPTPSGSSPPPKLGAASATPTSTSSPESTHCSPPYDFDELGRKIFKPECVN